MSDDSSAPTHVSSRPSAASAGTHTPQSIDRAGGMGPCVRRDDAEQDPIQCICIDPAYVSRVWPLVSHLIRAAMRKGRISEFADVEAAVLDGAQLLWVAADRQAIWAAAVTQLAYANGEKFCTIVACGGP